VSFSKKISACVHVFLYKKIQPHAVFFFKNIVPYRAGIFKKIYLPILSYFRD
jgi:hypothetical protein